MSELLDPRVKIGSVSLTVADLDRSVHYYRHNIGLKLLGSHESTAVLGAGSTPLVRLYELPSARTVRRVSGLYHFAILLPSRLELARTLKHLIETETRIDGASDHLISEALYLSDPDGHGIEIYRDQPRSNWYDERGNLLGDTLPLDVESILGELANDAGAWDGLQPDTMMEHIHLHVANLASADRFYVDVLGFYKPPTTIPIPSASFLNAGGYHHHLGLNTWAGVGAPPPPDDAARLLLFEILFPDAGALTPVVDRLKDAGIPLTEQEDGWLVQDPSFNSLLLRTGDADTSFRPELGRE
jgi:catechol 2,3-dioxygenase